MSDYGNLAKLVTGYLPAVTGVDEQTVLAEMLTRASRAIDSRARRPIDAFAPAGDTATARTFYGDGAAVLLLEEFVTGSVTIVTGTAGGVDYMPAGWREWRRREVTTGAMRVGLHTVDENGILTPRVGWTKGVPYIVTAKWGFAATPAEITEATYQLVRAWWNQQSGNLSGVSGDLNPKPEAALASVYRAVDELIAPFVLEEAVEDESAGSIERGDLLNTDFNPNAK